MLIAIAGVALLALYLLATLAFALSTVLPPLRQLSAGQYLRQRLGQLLGGGLTFIGIGLLPVLAGIEETAAAYLRVDFAQELTRHLTWIVPLITGMLSVRQANKQGEHAGTFAVAGLALVLCGLFTALYHLAHHTNLLATPAFMAWLAASALFALVCDINAISMHSYYRSRLAEAFLPEVGTQPRWCRKPPDVVPAHRCARRRRRAVSHHQHDAEHHELERTPSCARAMART